MSEYDPDNPLPNGDPPDTDEPESPTPIRRVGRRDRKRQIKTEEDSSLFDSLVGDAADTDDMVEPVTALPNVLGRPLPDDFGPEVQEPLQGDFVLDEDDRFPPVVIPRTTERRTRRARTRGETRPEIDRSQPMARKRRVSRQDRVALLFLLATIIVGGYFVYIWQNPYSVLNPLAPERPVIYVTATPGADSVENPASTAEPGQTIQAVFPYAVREGVQFSALADQCDRVILTGLIQGSGQEEAYAVRVSGGDQDEGVITTFVPEAGAQVYLISLPMPDAETIYMLQMYDLTGEALSAEVPVQVTPGCSANRASVNFTPRG